ncbi:MAG: DUF4270 domain-containing protein [Chitinophagales bacterium]|nr:DUF4270 domain-containing protein [Chitinophagales bacterium]MDW8426940.1 DUF4270 domain-containing protein [Chitinophagales bacterium]
MHKILFCESLQRYHLPDIVHQRLKKFFFITIGAAFFVSCNKLGELGVELLPGSDDIGAIYTDTFTLITHTLAEDSILSSSTVNNLCGVMFDPYFGRSYAAFFTELNLPTNDVDFGMPDTLFVDSVVLMLDVVNVYGYSQVPQTLHVYEVTEPMRPKPTEGYFSTRSFTVEDLPLGRKTLYVPNRKDSLQLAEGKLPPHLRIRLSDRLGQRLLQQSGSEHFKTDSNFKNFFKGICVAPDTLATPYGASIIYVNLQSGLSGLRLYWHTPTRDSLRFTFPITSNEVRTNYFRHNYMQSQVQSFLVNANPMGDSVVFVQGAAGVKARLLIPSLSQLKQVVINKAELVITSVLDENRTDSIFTPPDQLVCITVDSSGKDISLPDVTGPLQFGGTSIRKVTIDRRSYVQYRFSIAQQIQQLIDGKTPDRGLFLIPFRRAEVASRLVAGGGRRNDQARMKLILVYTPIK